MNSKNKHIRISLLVLLIVILGTPVFAFYHYGFLGKPDNEKVKNITTRYNFDNFDDFKFFNQDTATIQQYKVSEGYLFLKTRAQTYDRTKATLTASRLRTGKSSCRVFIPTMYPYDRTGIASFLYYDDLHEFDFEIGYGRAEMREKHNAQPNEVLCYMTSQDNGSEVTTLEMNKWYILDMDITLKDDTYFTQWLINGEVKAEVHNSYGSEYDFSVVLSVENLKFLGDHISNNDYEVKFDWLEITHYE